MSDKKETTVMANNRLVYLQGEFNEEKAEKIVTSLLEFEGKDPTKDIVMFIDSYGGHVHSFLLLHDVIRTLMRCQVATICVGKAMSCGQMLLISGAKGKRFITPNSRICMHEMSAGTFGKLSEIENDLDENKGVPSVVVGVTLGRPPVRRVETPSRTRAREVSGLRWGGWSTLGP